MSIDWYLHLIELTAWDNEGVDGQTDGDPVDDGGDNPDAGNQDDPKVGDRGADGRVFTQEDVDRMVTKRNKSLKAEYAKLEETYQNLLKQTNLSNEQRDDLEARLENVQKQLRTKEEQAKYEKQKAEEKFSTQIKEVQERADRYQQLFEQSTIHRAIIDSAMALDGFSGDQFVAYLAPKAKIVEELTKDGEPTGRLVPRIDWQVENEDGTTETVRMTTDEVVKLMREDTEKYGNMFKSNVSRGVGTGSSPSEHMRGGKIDVRKLTPDEYMKLAATEEGRRALGLSK